MRALHAAREREKVLPRLRLASDFGLTSFAGLHRLPDCPRAIRQTSPLRTTAYGLRTALALPRLRLASDFGLTSFAGLHRLSWHPRFAAGLGQTSPLRTTAYGLRAALARRPPRGSSIFEEGRAKEGSGKKSEIFL